MLLSCEGQAATPNQNKALKINEIRKARTVISPPLDTPSVRLLAKPWPSSLWLMRIRASAKSRE